MYILGLWDFITGVGQIGTYVIDGVKKIFDFVLGIGQFILLFLSVIPTPVKLIAGVYVTVITIVIVIRSVK